MSSSAYPRVYYSGHFYWNPSTYNNDDYSASGEGGFKCTVDGQMTDIF